MEPNLVCHNCGSIGFRDVTSTITALKGRRNRGMLELEVDGVCGNCDTPGYASVIAPIDGFTSTTASVDKFR